jgi:hypothetical protein
MFEKDEEMGGTWMDSEDGRGKKTNFFQIPLRYTLTF